MGPTLVFSQFQVLLSHLWGLKKKDRGKKRYKRRERSRTRKKEREEEGVKRKIIKNNKELLKKQEKPPAGFKLVKPVLLVFLAAAG